MSSNRPSGVTSTIQDLRSDGKAKKPTLVFHIGPQKTGTTSLQNILQRKKNELKSLDNVTFVSEDFRRIQKSLAQCFSKPIDENNCKNITMWSKVVRDLEKHARISTNEANETKIHSVIYSSEEYSNIPYNSFAINQLQKLQDLYDVKVIIFYRRSAGWFVSRHFQSSKFVILNRAYRARGFENRFEYNTASSPSLTRSWNDTLATFEFYQEVFGATNVKVLNFHAQDLTVEFFCNIGVTPNFCRRVQSFRKGVVLNKNSGQYLFDEDRLATLAYDNGYFHPKNKSINRSCAAQKIKSRFDAIGRENLPKQCLNSTDIDWLWERTLLAEKTLAPDPLPSERALRIDFESSVQKFCQIDHRKLLQTEYWKKLLSSDNFAKNRSDC